MRRFLKNQKGDTVLEVLVSMTILALVAGTAYATSTRTFHSSLNSQYRDQAVSIAQQQVELLRSEDNNGQIATFKSFGQPFCINPSDPANPVKADATHCINGQFTYSLTYNGDPPGGSPATGYRTFKVSVNWTSPNGIAQQTSLNYKASNSFNNTTGSTCPGCTQSVTTNAPAGSVSITVNPSAVNYGSTVQVQWTINNIQNGTCNGSNWTFNGATGQKTGTATSSALTTSPISNVGLTCTGFDGVPVTDTKPVTVSKVSVDSFKADSTSLPYNGSTILRWSSTSATSCTGTNFNTGGATNNASPGVSTGNLTATKTFSLSCAGPGGPATAPDVIVSVSSAPPTVTANGANSIGTGSANLTGTFNPNGAPATGCGFYYDTSSFSASSSPPGHGTGVGCAQSPGSIGSGTSAVNVNAGISGLSSGTTYHFQTCGQTAVGYACSGDSTFTTASPPPPIQVYFCYNASFDSNGQQCYYGPFPASYDCSWVESCGIPNDQISSSYSNNGSVNVAWYWDISYGGACANFNSNTGYVGDGWNDQLSSFRIGSYC